ncbi:SLATT domain-containing protein [Noviherbaspirillum aridicola]|uniref:SMODS and SLOG-associating 2TM effector domain-containing protein n=1 Tax=Noviherbaspirillum aridicola TaxID=2849687 RepID=A0ABQ4Q5J7_9BURK|nr:SLATT domain-containing protein [Noviherbaspirillum aridicola]GIZ52322.1 hypothetical protein NCCP691_23360 [Noviherbaspirillum aridicola]
MSEQNKRVEELQARVSKTAAARYRASERLEKHQKLSLWTLACLALALVLIPLIQTMEVPTGIEPLWLHGAEAVLAVLVLIYALLVGMEKFVAQTNAMRRSGVELDRLSRRIAARDPNKMTEAEFSAFVRDYFDIIDRYEHHQPVDYQFTRLAAMPKNGNEWPAYAWLWTRVQAGSLFSYLHYVAVLAFVAFVFVMLLGGIKRHADPDALLHLRSSEGLSGSVARADDSGDAAGEKRR